MAKLAAAGKIRAVGVSNFTARQMETAHAALAEHGIPLAMQVKLSPEESVRLAELSTQVLR